MSKALDAVVELLDLEQIELDIFRGRSPENERREGRKPIWSAPGGNRSAPLGVAETGGPLCKTLLEKLPPIFAVSPTGCSPMA